MDRDLLKRGDIFLVHFKGEGGGNSEECHPALIISNDIMNENSSHVIVAPIVRSSNELYSFEQLIDLSEEADEKVMLDQLRSITKSRIGEKVGTLPKKQMQEVDSIIKFVLQIS